MSPLIATNHTHYWEHTSSETHGVVVVARLGGYPLWQSASIAPLGPFGMLSAWWDTAKVHLRWWWQRFRQVRRLAAEERAVLCEVLQALDANPSGDASRVLAVTARALHSPHYVFAQDAVQQTAQTIGFNEPQAWVKLSHAIRDHSPWAENTWRHLQACHLLEQRVRASGSTMTNGDRHLLVQLAYVGYARRRW